MGSESNLSATLASYTYTENSGNAWITCTREAMNTNLVRVVCISMSFTCKCAVLKHPALCYEKPCWRLQSASQSHALVSGNAVIRDRLQSLFVLVLPDRLWKTVLLVIEASNGQCWCDCRINDGHKQKITGPLINLHSAFLLSAGLNSNLITTSGNMSKEEQN
ncbi:hypothetical protein HS088_TW12G00080 [Tripterygium wilfordii]|uniref:Uncharacterized protein n=1 Tax=Tripterygium wilfordii TaxID=458696 RepID=A0A7J7CXQ1_TRIWF|nr:hypothetical protein HS088_TW12G00080 [Tripterygium wilfordii]